MKIKITDHQISLKSFKGHSLHIRRFHYKSGPAVLLLHGAIENGRIFYSDTGSAPPVPQGSRALRSAGSAPPVPQGPRALRSAGKGLAPYLAAQGFDVFVADLAGRGKSIPAINENFKLGQTESIVHEIPAMSDFVASETKNKPQHWIAHSWGGVLMASALARKPKLCDRVASQIYFGTKRSIHVSNPQKILLIDIFWLRAAPFIAKLAGYLPSKALKMGSDSESIKSLRQSCEWVKPGPWVDSDDGFDYAKAIRKIKLPPTLLLAGKNDACLGHPVDVKAFRNEMGAGSLFLLARENGLSRDYGHLDMLTHSKAKQDVFPHASEWMRKHA